MKALHTLLCYTLWPFFLIASLASLQFLWNTGVDPELATFYVYIGFFFVLLATERVLPYKRSWLKDPDHQTPIDITLTVLYFVVTGLAIVVVLKVLLWLVANYQPLLSLNVWPSHWPLWSQIVVGIIITDLGNNLAHHMSHEIPVLWRFHAVHHSTARLGVVTTGRFHPVDVIQSLVVGTPIPFFLGAPDVVILWFAALNAYIGIMTHANIDFKCSIFNYLFNTPNVHRWHHSRVLREGNSNYGEVTMLWDRLFGTYYYPDPKGRVPPVNIGTPTQVPKSFIGMLVRPLTLAGYLDKDTTVTELPADAD
jgi:sterol desaturase/sphingolipid hydroxylase (fatty acid hydroxylase superfamily)